MSMFGRLADAPGRLHRYIALADNRVPLKGVLLLLLSVDAALIVLDVLYRGEASNFSISKDRAYPERFLYGKEALIVFLMGIAAVRNRSLFTSATPFYSYICYSTTLS